MYYFDTLITPVGVLRLVVSDVALQCVIFPHEQFLFEALQKPKHPIIVATKKQLKEYFAGKRKNFDLPIECEGTDFQKKAWKVLTQIPYSQTISYMEEAQRAKRGSAVRAIASANGKNPLPIIVPCHRVIASNGKLGGYSGGLEVKKFLLALEQKHKSI